MGFPAKGAFALTFLFKSSLRGCLRVFFYRQVLAAFGMLISILVRRWRSGRRRWGRWRLWYCICQSSTLAPLLVRFLLKAGSSTRKQSLLRNSTGALWVLSAFARPSQGLRGASPGRLGVWKNTVAYSPPVENLFLVANAPRQSVSPKSTEAFGDSPNGKISIYNQCF